MNTPSFTTDFLGWDPTVNDDIRIRHLTPSQPILFGTNGVVRMRISPNVNRSVLINAPAANNAKLRITQMRGVGAVQAELENMDGNALNRALRVGISAPFPPTNTIGVNTSCTGSSNGTDFALYAIANDARENYGVYGESFGVGVPGNPSQGNWAGVFTDDVVVTGMTFGSDEMIKQNIQPLENARENLMQLRPVSFKFIEHSGINFENGIQFGFVAQEVQEVIPSLVRSVVIPVSDITSEPTETLEHLALNQVELIPVLVEGVKAHELLLNETEDRISSLQEMLNEYTVANSNNPQDENE